MARLFKVKLTEQAELHVRQFTTHPAFPTILEMLNGVALELQYEAMNCRDKTKEARLLKLTEAQIGNEIVSRFIEMLKSYQLIPKQEEPEVPDPMDEIREAWN